MVADKSLFAPYIVLGGLDWIFEGLVLEMKP